MTATRAMTVAGIMSGTSADGVDVALVRITPGATVPRIKLLAHHGVAYPAALRKAVLAAMNAPRTSTAELARLNWRLGIAYAEAVRAALQKHPVKLDLIGCHGQTIYHQAQAGGLRGAARRLHMADRRTGADCPRNRRAGSFQFSPRRHGGGRPGRAAGSAAGFCVVRPPKASARSAEHRRDREPHRDSGGRERRQAHRVRHRPRQHGDRRAGGPAFWERNIDRDGRIAARGRVLDSVIGALLRGPYFRKAPPKSAGREQFGARSRRSFSGHASAPEAVRKTPLPRRPRSRRKASRWHASDSCIR